MEPQLIETAPITHSHANGETYSAESVEAAQGVCSFLARFSIEDAGIFLEFEKLGREEVSKKVQPPEAEPTQRNSTDLTFEKVDSVIAVHISESADPETAHSLGNEISLLNPLHDNEASHLAVADEQSKNEIAYYDHLKQSTRLEDITHEDIDSNQKVEPALSLDQYTVDRQVAAPLNVESISDEPLPSLNEVKEVEHPIQDSSEIDKIWEEMDQLLIEINDLPEQNSYREVDPSSDETYSDIQVDDVLQLESESTTTTFNEIPQMELPVSGEEVAEIMHQIIEVTSQPDSDAAIKALEIIEEIIQLPTVLEAAENPNRELLDAKLEEHIIELLEVLNIDYTPEHIEALVLLARSHYFDKVPELQTQGTFKESDTPQQIGTREFLQKLHQGILRINWQLLRLYKVGSSALRFSGLSQLPI